MIKEPLEEGGFLADVRRCQDFRTIAMTKTNMYALGNTNARERSNVGVGISSEECRFCSIISCGMASLVAEKAFVSSSFPRQ